MSSRSLNKVMLIGNLTRDPELKYLAQGSAVCTFGLATNRSWQPSDGGDRREETEYHRLVAWGKLAELCGQLLKKGMKIYIEGRLQTRSWDTPDGQQKSVTEVVADDMMILSPRRNDGGMDEEYIPAPSASSISSPTNAKAENKSEDINLDEIPF